MIYKRYVMLINMLTNKSRLFSTTNELFTFQQRDVDKNLRLAVDKSHRRLHAVAGRRRALYL